MTEQPALFPADKLTDQTCPIGYCQAHRLAAQTGPVVTCAHDLQPERRKRPAGCLNAHDPATSPFPEGF